MFSSKSKASSKSKKPTLGREQHAVTILTNGCHFSGKLYCKGSTRIAGRVEGHVHSEGFLVIEEDAIVTAETRGEDIVIQGQVVGKIIATSRVELCATSHVEGDIVAPLLVIKEGAQFNGHATMSPVGVEKQQVSTKVMNPPKEIGGGKNRLPTSSSNAGVFGPEIKSPSQQEYNKVAASDISVKQVI
jgi:cytoskeletal protein CcmA (bactofilin family)